MMVLSHLSAIELWIVWHSMEERQRSSWWEAVRDLTRRQIQRMVAEGHEVANHTSESQVSSETWSGTEFRKKSTGGETNAIERACGVRPTLLRLPGGNHNATVVANTHMPMIQWECEYT